MMPETGDSPARQGRVFQINISTGGVPKGAVRQARVTIVGLAGDRQRDMEHHGGPERAVTLYSLECILALQAEGHPIYPGSIGENLTLVGIDWIGLSEGTRLRIGDEVLLELTRTAAPCSNISASFIDERIGRVSHKTNPGWSRWCARVLQEGEIRIGDVVILSNYKDQTGL
jgi:MOSC domain-containing protein YiiM